MRELSTISSFLRYIRAAIFPALLFVLTASAAWATPTVTVVEPPDGSSPPVSTTVSATFSEPMDPATITNGSFTVSKSLKIKAVSAGPGHTVVLRTDGTVSSWGAGNGNFPVPPGLSGVTAISAGRVHSLALKDDGTVVAWGVNYYGQSTVPQGLSGVVAISAGQSHSLALKSDGTVVAWGYNFYGQSTVPPGLSGVVAISAGCYHSLALKSDGTVVGWGSNNAFTERLYSVADSLNSYVYAGQATVPQGLSGVIAISAGSSHSLALKSDGTVVAWGYNGYGQSWGESNVPTGLSEVVAISAGQSHSLALKSDGTVVGWGDNRYAQSTIPMGLSGVVAISAGYFHSMALKNDGTVVGWGDNTYAQTMVPKSLSGVAAISAGTYNSMVLQSDGSVVNWGVIEWFIDRYGTNPVPLGLSGVVAISAGDTASLALKNDGTVVAWGRQINVPPGLSGVIAISAGPSHSLALKNDGTVVAWGSNYSGDTDVPSGLSGVVAISSGTSHSLALKNDGTVVAWGDNSHGQSLVPPGLSGVVAISAGLYHSLVLKNDGTVVALGDNTYALSAVPPGLSGVVAISAGYYQSLALKKDGTVVVWGTGAPAVPLGLSGVVSIAAGYDYALALKNDGTVVGWGGNSQGQIIVPTSPYETVVQGSVVFDQTTNSATFTPTAPLEQGSTYIGRVNTGVRNASGEHLTTDVSWNFTPGQQANAAIVLANLSQPYDGTPKAVTATSDPSGLTVSITYNGSATPPTAVGSYTVVAIVNDAAYKGSATAVLTITNPIYTIGVSVVGGHGSISCDSPVTMGGTSICNITPDANYHLSAFTDNSVDKLGSVTANSYAIGNVTAGHNIQGAFAVNLSANAGPSQTITCSGPTGALAILDGSASTGAATYTWSGPFGTATGVNPTVTIPWGTHTITLTVADGTGKTASSSVSITVTDNVPPLINVVSSGTNGNNNWFVSSIDIGLNAADSCSGMREIRYTLDNNAEQVVTGAVAGFRISGDGSHTVSYRAIDNAGNEVGNNITFKIDSSAPAITGTVLTPPNANGWNNGNVTVHFSATDSLSGVASLTPDAVVTTEGAGQTVTGTAVDAAGNQSAYSVTGINVDKTPPLINAMVTPAPVNGWNNTGVTITFQCSDALSGIAQCPAPVIVGTEGANQSVTGMAVDKAGNTATVSVTLNIDKTSPAITGASLTQPNANGWNNGNVTVHFSATDSLSGVASLTPDAVVTTEGAGQTVTGTVVDMAGNSSSYTQTGINVDKTPPLINAIVTPAPVNGWNNTGVTITFQCSDALSGIAQCPAPVIVSTEGANQSVTGMAVDKAGNTATTSVTLNIDKTSPAITGASLTQPNANGWNNGNVTVHFSATDALSGVASLTPDAVVSTEGAGQTVTGTAVDAAGNQSAYSVTGINVDKTPPALMITGITNGAAYNLGLVPQARFTAVDGISGVATSSGTLTGGDAQGLGQFTYSVTATDKAGNTAITSVSYTVTATTTGTVALVNQLAATGLIDQQTAANLSSTLVTAMTFYASGNSTAGDEKMGAFNNQVNAPGQNIPPDVAAMLINAANYIIAHN